MGCIHTLKYLLTLFGKPYEDQARHQLGVLFSSSYPYYLLLFDPAVHYVHVAPLPEDLVLL